MPEPISVDVNGVHSLGDIHSGVAAGLGALTATPPGALGTSHGTIAAAVDSALASTLGSRSMSITGAQSDGALISELLHQSAAAYERGDQHGGDAIRAAADRIAQGPPAGAAADSPGGGAGALGQAMGQLSQLGQMGQALTAPLAALAAPLQQLPQQLMQGLQQMGQETSATKESGAIEIPEVPAEERERPDDETEPKSEERDDENGAAAGPEAAAEPAPIPPVTERPAPTRPAFD